MNKCTIELQKQYKRNCLHLNEFTLLVPWMYQLSEHLMLNINYTNKGNGTKLLSLSVFFQHSTMFMLEV